ncbi:hypothetical protein GWI33_019084 [Rhynchophorus ferrugineus]|uniref:Uncharacterized protein n=1 Tax=Rhynchophorus ferrugineus TaxID=354439 RepID=A0A834HWP7_RHYFE|nr:hypothetical protein GWI33_019084 [Rhynchophorus ferrugineus]
MVGRRPDLVINRLDIPSVQLMSFFSGRSRTHIYRAKTPSGPQRPRNETSKLLNFPPITSFDNATLPFDFVAIEIVLVLFLSSDPRQNTTH